MAAVCYDYGKSDERMTFADSSPDDMAYAKSFWQSIYLAPPIESTLVANDIKQRIKLAPHPSLQIPAPVSAWRVEEEFELRAEAIRAKGEARERQEIMNKISEFVALHEEDRCRLERFRQRRLQKENLAMVYQVLQPQEKPDVPHSDDEDDTDAQKALADIDSFEHANGLDQQCPDSDDEEVEPSDVVYEVQME